MHVNVSELMLILRCIEIPFCGRSINIMGKDIYRIYLQYLGQMKKVLAYESVFDSACTYNE